MKARVVAWSLAQIPNFVDLTILIDIDELLALIGIEADEHTGIASIASID